MHFEKYQHLERLGTQATNGITSGSCFVFPKLDGTNASVWFDKETNQLEAGSRNRKLEVENDNAGFYNHVLSSDLTPKLTKFFEHHPMVRLYGEWLVPHSLKSYRDDAWRKFYIFDVLDDEGNYIEYNNYKSDLERFELDFLSPLAIVKNGQDEDFRKLVDRNTYLIKDGHGVGEGIVIKNYNYLNPFGDVVWAKVVTNYFKEINSKEFGPAILTGGKDVEELIVDKYIDEHLCNKIVAKITLEIGGWSSKHIPRLLNTVFYDLITEETWNILKDFKNPKIDFRYLKRLSETKTKEVLKDLFS
mgnify:CR=1 FL=1